MTTVVVCGAIANKNLNGGNAWAVLSWARGLRRLGFDVHVLEQIAPEHCRDDAGRACAFKDSANVAYFRKVTEQLGLAESATLICQEGLQTSGPSIPELVDLAESTDLMLNITGHLSIPLLFGRFRRKAYLDFDPGFTQFWQAAGIPGPRIEGHDYYLTLGENIGKPGCSIPCGSIPWIPTRQPVVLEDWPPSPISYEGPFTTIAAWRNPYGVVEYEGRTFGLKLHEFRKFVGLPDLVPHSFEIALDIHPAETRDLDSLHLHGWRVVDPAQAAPDALAFRNYVSSSTAEFSVAQGIYVETRSGWFSDRTARYLASGKPALVQDTGFSSNLPTGEGLLAFMTLDQAARGAEIILQDYERHSRAARAIAARYFDSDQILSELIDRVGICP
jgi:hypothetical protein